MQPVVKPLRTLATPKYPDKAAYLRHSALEAALPLRWQGRAAVTGALAALALLSLTGCMQQTDASLYNQHTNAATDDAVWVGEVNPPPTVQWDGLLVAPLFAHGEGRGAFGCVMVTPPAFLSEAEALSVINEEAAAYGLTFTQSGITFQNVRLPGEDLDQEITTDYSTTDGKVALELVTFDQMQDWPTGDEMISSVVELDLQSGAACLLHPGMDKAESEATVVAVLYDPCTEASQEALDRLEEAGYTEESQQAYTRAKLQATENDLRAQMKDFLSWLQGQGVI